MKTRSIWLMMAVFAASCSQTEKNYVARVKFQKLTEAEIFNKEMVYDVIFDSRESGNDSLKNQSRQLFLKGIDTFKNKKDPNAAVSMFRQSILIYPDAKTYYELGNALLEAKSSSTAIKDAVESFEVARYLDFQPASAVYYKLASANNVLLKSDQSVGIYSVVYNLENAFNSGFSDTATLLKDNNLRSIISTPEYKEMLSRVITKNGQGKDENVFSLFRKSFEVYEQPYEINFQNLDDMRNKQSISYDFARFIPEMQNTSFGRDVSHDFFYVAKVAETSSYTALIYSSISFWEADMQPVITKLSTYDNEGNLIATKVFAGQFSAEKVKTGKIKNNEITLQDYKRVWKQPIDKVPFDENEVDKYELKTTATFRIADNGEIVELSVPANYSDSVVFAKN
jgi:tetratricopeptide (TPR) repeat protein